MLIVSLFYNLFSERFLPFLVIAKSWLSSKDTDFPAALSSLFSHSPRTSNLWRRVVYFLCCCCPAQIPLPLRAPSPSPECFRCWLLWAHNCTLLRITLCQRAQSVVPGPAASTLPANSLKMQTIGIHSWSTEPLSWWFFVMAALGNY